MTGEEWLSLPIEKVVEILSSDELEVEREEYVFDAATTWLHHSYATRSSVFHKVLFLLLSLEIIRFAWLHNLHNAAPETYNDYF